MIEFRSLLEIKPSGQDGGWELVLWIGDAFDYTTPFRAMLAEIAEALGQDRDDDLQLPPYEGSEDFVEGTPRFGDAQLQIYYEHSLGHLDLMRDSEEILRDVARRIRSIVQIA